MYLLLRVAPVVALCVTPLSRFVVTGLFGEHLLLIGNCCSGPVKARATSDVCFCT